MSKSIQIAAQRDHGIQQGGRTYSGRRDHATGNTKRKYQLMISVPQERLISQSTVKSETSRLRTEGRGGKVPTVEGLSIREGAAI